MLQADDASSGPRVSTGWKRPSGRSLETLYIPVHQGRATENVISQIFINEGDVIPMNYHFTTTKAHMEIKGEKLLEIYTNEALK